MAKRPVEIRYKSREMRAGDLDKAIKKIPKELRRDALLKVIEFFQKKFMKYPRYKRVRRAKAYPEVGGFFSDAQRRYVFAMIKKGKIKPGRPHRTMTTKKTWRIENAERRDIRNIALVNDAPSAVHLYHPKFQARQPKMVGWKTVDTMRDENLKGAMSELKKWIRKNAPEALDKSLRRK